MSNLTETILTLQNEIQSSIDWAETNLRPPTETEEESTKAEVFMNVSTVNVKLPILLSVEEETLSLEDIQTEINEITDRKGLLITDNGDGTGLYTKIKVENAQNASENPALLAHIEITFTPVER